MIQEGKKLRARHQLPLPSHELQRTRTLMKVSHRVSLRSIFHRLMPEILTILPLIFPRRILPGHVTYCREIRLQQSKGPGLCSGQDQSSRFWFCNGFWPLLGRVSSLPASLLPRKALGLSSAEPVDAAGFKLPGTAELFLTALPIARTESF